MDQDKNREANKRLTSKVLLGIVGLDIVVISIVILFLYISSSECNSSCCGNGILSFLIVAMACLMGGIILGFLFSIPRLNKLSRGNTENPENRRDLAYSDNTNLEDISDWLTKIIVGISLVQFTTLLNMLHVAAINLSESLCPGIVTISSHYPAYFAFAYGCILFFSFSGFGIGYIWTRIVFTNMLFHSRAGIEQDYKIIAESAQAAIVKDKISKSEIAFSASDLDKSADENKISRDVRNSLLTFRTKVREKVKQKPIYVPDDLQKGRWGGKNERNGKLIKAIVTTSAELEGFYNISIYIEKSDGVPLTEPVAIMVHDSYEFQDNAIYLNPADDKGKVNLELLGFEAFTIGAYFGDGTELELDLNEQSGYPKNFYWEKNKKLQK